MHHDILHQRPGPDWNQPILMNVGWLTGQPNYKNCFALPIANPDHPDYLGRLNNKDEPYENPTIKALQGEFNEIMEQRNLSRIRSIFAAIQYNNKVARPYYLLECENERNSSPELVKKKKKKKKQNKKTE
ncbi:unnamed protein product [Rhizophagus irregularis]|nr:unnamed protein product [Rhizophagus irregularis]